MQVDVDQVLLSKNPQLHKKLPGFVIRWIKKIIHQDEVNYILQRYEQLPSIDFATAVLAHLHNTVRVVNEENIPKKGRYIVVCNHPLGGLDGLAMISLCGRYRKDIKFPVNDLLMHLEPMRDVFIPINKHGSLSGDAMRQFQDAFESDDLILFFPAGLCSRKQKGIIEDLEWKKTVITKAKQTERDIIPAYFDGRNSDKFYRIANLRKRLGIKANLEMIFLPGELFRQKGNSFRVVFGTPISYKSFDDSRNDKEWVAWLKEKTYQLKPL